MPIIPVKIEEAEELDSKIEIMCGEKSAILIQSGGTFSDMFPKAMDRARVFRKKYLIALGTGFLLFTRAAEISIYFNYRDKYAEVQLTRRALEDLDDIFPIVRAYLYRMSESLVEKIA